MSNTQQLYKLVPSEVEEMSYEELRALQVRLEARIASAPPCEKPIFRDGLRMVLANLETCARPA
jgi:hypothetical protein